MNLNNLMHARNIYKDNPPDFKDLAQRYPYFKEQSRENTNGRVTLDFKNPTALRALLYALLEKDFSIKIEIPLDRLIPTLPLRLNYIHWIEDLLKCLDGADGLVTGVDIGSGASCVYPLLGARLNGWRFLATEVDESSARYARDNVQRNGLKDNITVQLVTPGTYLIQPLQDANLKKATFCMCNPPFFSSEDDAVLGESRTDKRPVPISVSTGSANETVTKGGEVEFVKGIINESLKLRQTISWYSSMFGKKSSMKAIVAYLKENKVGTVVTTQFCQGKTMRWGVAWTFIEGLAVDSVKSPLSKRKKKENKPLLFVIPADSPVLPCQDGLCRFEEAVKWMDSILIGLKVTIDEHQQGSNVCQWQCSASDITWANQRQKRRKRKHDSQNFPGNTSSDLAMVICDKDSSLTALSGDEGGQTSNSKSSDKHTVDMEAASLVKEETTDNTVDAKDSPLCTFQVSVDSKDDLRVEIQCIWADNKNHVYQFYQFLQNKLLKGL